MEFGLYRILEFATLLSSTKTLLVSIMHSRYFFLCHFIRSYQFVLSNFFIYPVLRMQLLPKFFNCLFNTISSSTKICDLCRHLPFSWLEGKFTSRSVDQTAVVLLLEVEVEVWPYSFLMF